MNFKIIDEQGEIGDTYSNNTERSPQNITEGITCKSQMVLCVNNESSKVKLQYFDKNRAIFSDFDILKLQIRYFFLKISIFL